MSPEMIQTAQMGLAAWTLHEIVTLKTAVAVMQQKISDNETNQQHKQNKMKKILILSVLIGSTLATFTGCATITKLFTSPAPSIEIVSTNSAGVLQTNDILQVQPNTNLVAAIKTGQTIAPLLPQPIGGIASGVLALLAAGLGLYAKSKNTLANSALTSAAKANSLLTTVVAGVEAAGDVGTKTNIARMSTAANNASELDNIVQAISQQMAGYSTPVATVNNGGLQPAK